ncbi:hypothetical protein CPB83DRAFT_846216 [Crepidotus variabilis]|uniref:NOT2/NOT3/NOT5 C-terminal domain-containing protein n=1 Tax=Crepidotus variabilis TaxID=179855 RepID=A0A9P6JVB1_9AGAR|nr:hypothetical protein CPB83DRAFT_846216 [Crepidotus variabilis]
MNRPGQPQQRPPNLSANPTLASQFRPSYPAYGLPPRNVLQSAGSYVPSLQPSSHRTTAQQSTAQSLVGQLTPGGAFNQTRGTQGTYTFGGGLGQQQHPPSTVLGLQTLPSQQQQPNGTPGSISSLLQQSSVLGGGPSISSTSEVGLDPNDFPALGSGPTTANPSSSNNGTGVATATSYASQAGTGVLLGGTGSSGGGSIGGPVTPNQTRDFTPDDFPALGGAPTQQNSQQQSRLDGTSTTTTSSGASVGGTGTQDGGPSHPPGLNGFQPSEQQLRQNMLGSHSTGVQQTPGLLNLGPTHRNVHPGFQGQADSEKQQPRNNFSMKLNQVTQAAWNSAAPLQNQPPGNTTHTNGSFPQNQSHPQTGTAPSNGQSFSASGLNATDLHTTSSIPNPNGNSHPMPANNAPASVPTATSQPQHPQTPAQQVLISAADRWGLLSLIAFMRSAGTDMDHGLTSIGTDLGTMGLDMAYPGNLYSTFITPWADQSAARSVEPAFHLPQCYQNVQAPPPGPAKASMFSDETLFFMFYASPKDALQEVAAQELWNRNWRFHKDLRLWLTKESGTSPSQKVQGGLGEQGQYTFWDPENWTKERKEMTVLYSDLEEKSVPAFVQGTGLVLATNGQPQTPQPQQEGQLGGQPQLPTRAAFQMGMAGL